MNNNLQRISLLILVVITTLIVGCKKDKQHSNNVESIAEVICNGEAIDVEEAIMGSGRNGFNALIAMELMKALKDNPERLNEHTKLVTAELKRYGNSANGNIDSVACVNEVASISCDDAFAEIAQYPWISDIDNAESRLAEILKPMGIRDCAVLKAKIIENGITKGQPVSIYIAEVNVVKKDISNGDETHYREYGVIFAPIMEYRQP